MELCLGDCWAEGSERGSGRKVCEAGLQVWLWRTSRVCYWPIERSRMTGL